MSAFKAIQIGINYHGKDEEVMSECFDLTADELRAVTRHLSSMRISDVEEMAVLPMKNLIDRCTQMCKRVKGKDQ